MMIEFIKVFYELFIDMAYYLMLGVTVVGALNLFMNKEFIARQLGKDSFWSSIKACLFGVPLPLCSCAVVPTGLYLKDKGASTSTTAAFLISTPQTGVDSIVATYGMMGLTFAWYRPLAAFVSGVLGGWVVGLFAKDEQSDGNNISEHPQVDIECVDGSCTPHKKIEKKSSIKDKFIDTLRYSYIETISDISVHFVIGLVIATLVTIFLPADLIVNAGLNSGILAMLLMIAVGLPMYICSTASIPIAISFMMKGISPGAAFVFLFMGPFTNAASLSILIKKLGKKVVTIYVTVAGIASILFGLLLDLLVVRFGLNISAMAMQEHMHEEISLFKFIVALIFAALLLYSLGGRLMNFIKARQAAAKAKGEARTFNVEGMTCGGCSSRLQALLLKNKDIDNAEVDNSEGIAKIWGNASDKAVLQIIENAGFEGSI